MSFALTKFRAWSRPEQVPVAGITKQHALLEFTAAASNNVIDFSVANSTFFTDVANSVVDDFFAAMRLQTAALLSDSELKSPQIAVRVKVASITTTGQYKYEIANKCPKITFDAGDGNTSYTMEIEWLLAPNYSGFNKAVY